MKIFIAGCGRSGTTLARDLMNCFQDTYVLVEGPYGEAPFTRYATLSRPEANLVIKRTGECWETLPSLPGDIALIYCVRHPFDSMTSTHPLSKHERRFHITPERWISEYRALHALRAAQPERRIFYLRYEDLVRDPNEVQHKMAEHTGLAPACRFTDNPAGIQIFTNSVEKWRKNPEFFQYLQTIPYRFRPAIRDFCVEFEYELPASYISKWGYIWGRIANAASHPRNI